MYSEKMKPQGIGKSLKKCGKQKLNKSPPPKGVEIIAAMFKQQSAGVSRGSTSMPSNVGHSSDNSNSNDVTVVKVESKYFGKTENKDDSKKSIPEYFKKKRSSSRLRLKQSISKKLLGDEVVKVESEIKTETADNEESPSRTENSCNVNSDKGESSLKVGRSIRLSLGKRKLSEDLEDFVNEDKKKNETKLLKKEIMKKSDRKSSTSIDHHKSKAEHKIRKIESSRSVKCSSGTTRDTNVQKCMRDTEVKVISKHACAKELAVATVDLKLDIKESPTQDSQSKGTDSQSESRMENSKTTNSQTTDSQTTDKQTMDFKVIMTTVLDPLRLTEQDLQRLASCFGSGWEMFVGQLGVGSEKVDQKKIENPTHVPSQVYNCLLVWFRQCPTQPTITVFDQTVQNSLDFCTVNMDKYETLKREIEKR
ncbi:hypothetical protein KP79_PYT15308 [Mizuhopecten yessoensis]|uniref:Death domain-containing protein n=1 Tax=Mizuhopecten yessoensis TaxID=6573 RepID=A0A210QZ79_MIZYE|nr:hypothetical protein KP79_PYT15308 [Mizuhopecten yessoensis]